NMGGSLPLDFSGLNSSEWPLIGYLYQDNVYKAQYDDYVQEIVDDAFSVSNIQSQYAIYSALIEPYATTELDGYTFLESSSDFQSAVSTLNSHVVQRANAVNSYFSN
ncbi:MAG: CotH kinase family protein, partial [Bacteroidia bacterium]|nr:CotH kinase family protein [Bacteroidia bacterium]